MNFAKFFIDRPIFASAISIAIIIFGAVAMTRLSVSQYPEVVPPTVVVTANYPGASAETVASTVATPIEQEVNGVDNMLYMYSNSTSDGEMRLTVTFQLGTDLDEAQVLVQNRVALAEARLPEAVRQTGVSVRKETPDMMLVVQIYSPDQSRDQLFVSNFATQRVIPVLSRIPGVGNVNPIGSRDYSMRIWLDPDKIQQMGLTAGEVIAALRNQNTQVAGGQLAQPPQTTDRAFQPTISLQGRFDEVSEFASIIVKRGDAGQIVRLSDVARVELGAENYRTNAYFNGQSYVPLLVSQQPGANAIETSKQVLAAMQEMENDFPAGMAWDSTYNPTEFFVEKSIEKLNFTIYEAIGLVMLVIVVFLQSFRASLIPLFAIPVSLVGTFIFMAALGYNINMLTLFGLVLAVGIVVDDAIIVVENVERNLQKGLSPREATRKSMTEITTALISNGLVLAAVFIPTLLLDGISGEFFRQFGIAISVATLLSVFNSLTLSPALSRLLLRHEKPTEKKKTWFTKAGDLFNSGFDSLNNGYAWTVRQLIRYRAATLAVFLGITASGVWLLQTTPRGFIPESDMGFTIMPVQLPAGSSLARTDEIMQEVVDLIREIDGVGHTHSFPGFYGLTGTTTSAAGTLFAQFTPFEDRVKSGRHASDIIANIQQAVSQVEGAAVNVIPPPTVRGLGTGGGFALRVQDYEARGSEALYAATSDFLGALWQDDRIQFAFTPFDVSSPDYFIDVDRAKAEMLGIPVERVHEMLEVYLGSVYINDFNLIGRTYQVRAQADGDYRLDVEQLAELRTRSLSGEMVPLGSIATIEPSSAPNRAPRYNLFGTAEIIGASNPSLSSQETLALVEELAAEALPQGFGIEWTDMSYQEKINSGGTALFLLSIVFVFLVLASQYESIRLPFAIILILPVVLFAGLLGVRLAGMDNNILTQISLVVLVGLAAKNAILIVEFARQLEDEGRSPVEAAIESARLRLRPIMMTSFAFILGVVPLMTSTGAGAELRQVIGTTVFSGMLGVTFFGLAFTPVFYATLREMSLFPARDAETAEKTIPLHAEPSPIGRWPVEP